jgi:hypothetical protein
VESNTTSQWLFKPRKIPAHPIRDLRVPEGFGGFGAREDHMAATKLVMNEADEDMGGDKLSAERISYAREFTAAAAEEEEEEGEEEDVGAVKATVSNNRLQVLPCLTVGSSSIAADAHHGYRREIVIPASCCVDPGVMELSLITGNLDESYSFVTGH